MLGVGGGIVIVPALAWVFSEQGVNDEVVMHLAVGTSLATIVPTAVSSVRAHHQRRAVRWEIVRRMVPGFALGAVCGALVVDALATSVLRSFFGGFVTLVGLQTAFGLAPSAHRDVPGRGTLGVVATGIGAISTLVGIGGGNMVAPFLLWCNVPVRNAVATAAAAGLPIAAVGSAGFMLTGLNHTGLPAWSTGFVYWPAFFGVAVMSVLCAPLGARAAHHLPADVLRRSFGVFLILVGSKMLFG
jgi:uncharacterized membrane protein YfcA